MRLTDATLVEGTKWLCQQEPKFLDALSIIEKPKFQTKPDGFGGLLQSIVSQQLSTKAAKTIWSRVEMAGLTEPTRVLETSIESMRACGLSHQKIRYAKALAEADIDYLSLQEKSTDEVIDALVPILGIGRWSAQMYALFALQHTDVFAPKDLGLQHGIRKLFALPDLPSEKEVDRIASTWSPWRSVASLILWSYHDKCPG